MGLPMFQEPDDAIAHDAAAKLDRAAGHQRSSIRRQATVRPSRYGQEGEQYADRERYRSRRLERHRADLHIVQLEAELDRVRAIRMRHRTQQDRESNRAVFQDARDLVQSSRDTFVDDNENDVSTRAPSPVRRLPRPTRESNLRFEVGAQRSGSVSPRRLRLLSPPSSSGSGRNIPDGPIPDGEPANLTPDFAPARGPYRDSPRPEDDDIPTPPPETWGAAYPPLRRVGHMSPRPPRLDGLGDRRRSMSPDAEEETWVNMLTTMDDTRSNSAATSFASSVGRSRSSQNTSTSFGEIGQLDESCDLDLPSGITEDDVRELREQHRRQRRRDQPDGPVMTGEQGLREHEERVRDRDIENRRRTRYSENGMFRTIFERMSRREEIPDEWWAAVGLTNRMH